jgi:hypothetical protein
VLLLSETLDLLARLLERAVKLPVALAEHLELILELTQRQTQLSERRIDVVLAIAAAEPLVAKHGLLFPLHSAHHSSSAPPELERATLQQC